MKTEKVNVRVVPTGSVFYELDLKRIRKWNSELFKIECIENRSVLPRKSDLKDDDLWGYSDYLLEKSLPVFKPSEVNQLDLTIFILDAPIEDDYLIRIIGNNRIVLTYYDARDFLLKENIPLENYLISNIYTYVLLLLAKVRSGQEAVLTPDDEDDITHDYREGCIYDFCGTKEDIVFSCVKPIICNECTEYLERNGISTEEINQAKKELKRLKRTFYYSIVHAMKKHPVWTFILSCWLAIFMSLVANCFTNYNCCLYSPVVFIWLIITAFCIIGPFVSSKLN